MKKLNLFIITLMLAAVTSCQRGNVTCIRSNDGKTEVEITYSGRIVFDEANAEIKAMAPKSYIKYKKDDRKLNAESDTEGRITYELDNGEKVAALTTDDKQFLAEAIKAIVKQRGGKK
jgi:hypothetical protein